MKAAEATRNDGLGRFMRERGGRAYGAALALCGDSEEAKELVQEAFYRVLRAWARFDKSQSLDAWFLTILRNIFTDSRRRYERRHGVSLDEPLGEREDTTWAEVLPENVPDMAARLEQEETARALRRVLESLSKDHRTTLRLCDMEGRSYGDIAQRLRVSEGTVRSRVNRARQSLRHRWLAEGDRQ